MRSVALLALLVALTLGLGGCAGAVPDTTVPKGAEDKPLGSTEELKKMLEEIANTGATGSAAAGLRPSIEELQKSNPAKGDVLMKDLQKLEATESPEQAKAIAKRMAAQL